MDVSSTAAALTALLAPLLPYLSKAGEKAADEIGKRVDVEAGEKLMALWQRLWPKIEARATAKEALEDLVDMPDDEDSVTAFRIQLKKILSKDGALALESAGFVEVAQADDRGIAIKGNVDRSIVVTGDGNYINVDDSPETLLNAYYASLATECSRVPLGIIDPKLVDANGDNPLPLTDIYIDLDVTNVSLPKEGGKVEWRKQISAEGPRSPLLEALVKFPKVVVMGDPGSGKSTFVNYMSHLLASDATGLPNEFKGLNPVRLMLRSIANCIGASTLQKEKRGHADIIWNAIEEDISERLGQGCASKLTSHLQNQLCDVGGFILLDGLDEVSEAEGRRQYLLDAVVDFVSQVSDRSRILITVRPYAYAEPKWRLKGYPVLALTPFSEEQRERFIDRWYQAVRIPMGKSGEECKNLAQGLQSAVATQKHLRELAQRPLLLTLMATLHTSWGQLPNDRAELYEESVKLLLGRWQKPQGGNAVGISQTLQAAERDVRDALEALAYNVHARQQSNQGQSSSTADINEGELLAAFKPLLKYGPDELITFLKDRAGLLIAREEGVYAFPHRSFQEYLAACYLANRPDFAHSIGDLLSDDPKWWREVFLLGVGKKRRGGLGDAVAVVNALLPTAFNNIDTVSVSQWYAALLAGEALDELNIQVKRAEHASYDAIYLRSRDWLSKLLLHNTLPASDRAEAGRVLGKLGDPRPEVLTVDTMHFCRIPAGVFVMGEDEFPYDVPYEY